MGLLASVLAESPRAIDDRYYPPSGSSSAGVAAEAAMTIPAFYDGVTLISEDIGKVPLQIFEDLGDAGRRRTSNHPLGDILSKSPNDFQTAIEFREMITAFAILRKFGIAEIVSGPRGPVDQLVPLHPDLVREAQRPHRYLYQDPKLNGEERVILPDEAFVLRGKLGKSVLEFASQSLMVEQATERYAADLFRRGARFQGVLQHPKAASDTVRKGLRKALDETAIGGPRSGRPLLLEEGMTWQSVSLTNKDAEFLATRAFGIRQVARWLRVPPHKIADLADSNYSNIEQESINYVTDTLLSWAIRWEQAIWRDLIIGKDRFYARHNLDGLLRGDFATRAEGYAKAIQWGWMTRNEVREKENLNPIDGLEEPLTPLNMSQGSDGAIAVSYAPRLALEPGEPAPAAVRDLSPAARGHLRLLASDAASRVARREHGAIGKLADRGGEWNEGVRTFFADHGQYVATVLHVPEDIALEYARRNRDLLLASGPAALGDWVTERVSELTDMALEQHEDRDAEADRITATVDAGGNRTAVTLDGA